MESHSRFIQDPGSSFFLFGPRGTGKSTWLRMRFPDALWLDLLDPETARSLQARPERLIELVAGARNRGVVVIDEVQRAPELLPVVHKLIEERRGLRFVLTGSSARKLRRTGVDLLAGRATLRAMHPFMAAELGRAFDLERALAHGLVPLAVAAPSPADVLRTYAALYLREEVQAEGLVRNVGSFARFLEVVSFSHGAVVNVAAVARECAVERKIVSGYLDILEDLLLAWRVPVFARRAARATSVHPKLYLFDAGVYRAIRPTGPLDSPSEVAGAALEGLVAQHLRAWIDYGQAGDALHYWRTRSGVEVDFVVYGPRGLWALEVKHTEHVRPEHVRALRAFRQDYPEARALLLHRGRERLEIEGIACLPVAAFLRQLDPRRALDAGV
ncbi:MAG: ATP-binding protein [Myxococcales bacterium]|nr:ATP-binding protein [Myxococcales bacterium]